MQYGFVIDQRRCIGCHACTVACKAENDVPVGSFRTWVKYTEIGSFPAVKRHFAVLRCNQCTDAPCVTICPVNALDKRVDGIVDLDRDACIGCKACMQACPYDALYLNEDTGVAEKCHFCAHRVERGLQPACEVVCPTQAIISGDLHDPESRVSQLANLPGAVTRRPEQHTGPNVWYVGADPVSLNPGTAREPDTWLWSDRRDEPPPYRQADLEKLTRGDARTVLDVSHEIYWGWKVSLYLVTKGIAAGAGMLALVLGSTGAGGFVQDYLPEILALVFLNLTTALLVLDLKRPGKFLTLLTRPNTDSWLVKGAWVLMGFGALTAGILGARLLGWPALADFLRWPNALLAAMAAGYTALLFAQCEGRDLWQRPLLLPHLVVQGVLLGGVSLLPFAPDPTLVLVVASAAALHLVFALLELRPHGTANARQATALLTEVPAWRGAPVGAFRSGLALSTGAAVLLASLALAEVLGPSTAALACAATWLGTFLYEQAYLRAGQLPPLS